MTETKKWKAPQVEMAEAVDNLSTEGKKEWELAAGRAVIQKLTEECQSLFDQVQILEKEVKDLTSNAE